MREEDGNSAELHLVPFSSIWTRLGISEQVPPWLYERRVDQ